MKNERTIILGGFIAFFALTLYGYITDVGGPIGIPLKEWCYVISPLIAVIFSFGAVRLYGLKSTYGYPLFFLSLGLFCWFVGEALWVYYEFILAIDPFPSVADYFYLAAYPLFAMAFFVAMKKGELKIKSFDKIIVFLFGLNALWLFVLVGYFGIYLAYDPAATLIENAVSIAYGVGDLVIFLACLLSLVLAWEYREGRIVMTWMYFFAGFTLILVSDIFFALYYKEYELGIQSYRITLDMLWILGYLYFGFGMYELAYLIRDIQGRALRGLK